MKEPKRMFWLVWNEQRSGPTRKHFSEQAARFEAMHLAKNNPGSEFHILGLVVSCAYSAVIWRTPEPDGDIEF